MGDKLVVAEGRSVSSTRVKLQLMVGHTKLMVGHTKLKVGHTTLMVGHTKLMVATLS